MKAATVDIIIPARGGSKGIVQKNLVDLGGQPLLAWAIDLARKTLGIRRIVVSTDDAEIASVAKTYGATVPYFRPASLSCDKTHPVYALLHDFDWCQSQGLELPDYAFMLLPTSPFRQPEHLQAALELYRQSEAYSVVSVSEATGQIRALRRLDGLYLREAEQDFFGHHARRQDIKTPFYALNGCFYLSTPERLRQYETFIHHDRVQPYVMPFVSSIDIDSEEHLEVARALIDYLP